MKLEQLILAGVWIVCIPVLLLFPRERYREVILLFLFNQAVTWLLSLIITELGAVSNPVREFPRALAANFSFNFVFFPTTAVFFVCFYPLRGIWRKLAYTVAYVGVSCLFVYIVARYTLLIRFDHFPWIWRAFIYLAGFFATLKYYQWFYRLPAKGGLHDGDRS
ncbi:CBO0543 family protein [Paenibacillus sepulcri]|uniref:Uncharacterized protein n=1 Tax=Paenibacillus sepulcri TaxID=359917 RepID=A0ABS7C4T5_9BACL|nr:hypothetical protein [Paenibacillus sepulcri]